MAQRVQDFLSTPALHLLLPVIILLFSQSSHSLPVVHSVESNSVHHHQNQHHSLPLSRVKPVPKPQSSTQVHHPQARFRLKSIVPVDLYNPCSMEDENWSETYLFDQSLASSSGASDDHEHSKDNKPLPPVIDEKYSLADVVGESLVSSLEDANHDVLFDQTNLDESSGQAKVTQLTSAHHRTSGHNHRDRFGLDLLKEMLEKAAHLQGLVTDMIRKHLIPECQHLELPQIMEIPKQNVTNPNLVTSLSGIYQTLANQTAHLYLIWRQQRKQSARRNGCHQHGQAIVIAGRPYQTFPNKTRSTSFSNLTTTTTSSPPSSSLKLSSNSKRLHARRVADDFLIVSSNLRGLMCHFQQAFRLFELPVPTRAIVSEVLSHTFTGSLACSRMSVVDCQLMKSSVRIFADIEAFLRVNSGSFFAANKSTTAETLTLTPAPATSTVASSAATLGTQTRKKWKIKVSH